jgi:cell division protein FtsQ
VNVAKLLAWGLALTLVALPILGVLNGWFASDRWPVTRLSVSAEFNHVSAEQIRAAAQPQLGKGFFALDLYNVRDALAKLPWVERAEVRKRWPDTVDLLIYEQQPYARWGGERLVNRQGRLFSVAGADGLQGLPRLAGPDDRLDDVLRFYADSQREFSGSGLVIDAVTLSPRGGWRIELVSGTVIELGRTDAQARLQRFLDVWPRLAGSHPQAPAYVDLRYANGFSMRWPDEAGTGDSELGIREKPDRSAGTRIGRAGEGFAMHPGMPIAAFSNHESRTPHPGFPESPIPALP